jgi:hypothetical protein
VSSFTGPLDLRFHDVPLSEKPFELLTPFEYRLGEKTSPVAIRVPAGYRTDFASIPRFFHRVINPIGRHGKAAVIHDWLCDVSPKPLNHKEAAVVFGEAMRVLNVPRWRVEIMVSAVMFFGPKFNRGDITPNS